MIESHGFFAMAMMAAVLLGVACAPGGVVLMVKRMSLTGDMLAHAVLPGVVVGVAGDAPPLVILLCALGSGLAGQALMSALLRTTRLKQDAVLGIVLCVFFAFGIWLISRWQPTGVQHWLYGQLSAVSRDDVELLFVVAVLSLILSSVFLRAWKTWSFDAGFAALSGFPVRLLGMVFHIWLTSVIVVAMQAVGVVLVTALLVTPAVAATRWTARMGTMMIVATAIAVCGAGLGVIGSQYGGFAGGPAAVLSILGLTAASFLVGPRDGVIARHLHRRRIVCQMEDDDLLKVLWKIERSEGGKEVMHASVLRRLKAQQMIDEQGVEWTLSDAGRRRATELVRGHRLWESYLWERANYAEDHVHDDAERVEHLLDDKTRELLAESLGHPQFDPHGKSIPEQEEGGQGR
jgi:manganese/zinc/iron transport system permease protein